MAVIRARAGGLVRRGWRVTLLLALLAGLASGTAMATVAAGRRTATVYDRFAAYADVPELLLNFCPPDFDPGAEEDLSACYTYDAAAERDVLVALPEVEAAARGSFRGVTVARPDAPAATIVASTLLMIDDGIVGSPGGRYRVVDGQDADGADEVVLNEHLARRAGLRVGDDAVLTFWARDELGTFGAPGMRFSGPALTAQVVGIGRSLTDLASAQQGFGVEDEASVLFGTPALAEATSDAGGFGGVLVEAVDDDAAAADAAIRDALPDAPFNSAPALGNDEIEPTRDAVRYEAHATTVLGAIVSLLAVAFVAQLVARQSAREWQDGPVLRAVGMRSREAIAAALLRGTAIGVPAAVFGVVVAVLASPVGPVGVGRRAEVSPGMRVDIPVLVGGAAVTILCAALGACAPLLRGRALRTRAPEPAPERTRRAPGLPPVASAGLHLARSRPGQSVEIATALASAGLAVVAVIAAVGLTASFDDLAATPMRYGAPWDVSVGAALEGPERAQAVLAEPDLNGRIDQAAIITGTDLRIDGETAWVHAYVPLEGVHDEVVPLPIGEGRPPATDREIALGALTMASLGRSIGDTVTLDGGTTDDTFDMTIVGTTIINDNFEASPGRGAAVTPGFIAAAAPEITGDPIILSLVPGADPEALVRDVGARYDGAVQLPVRQAAVRNVGRIRSLPYVVAAVVALLAAISLVHALVLSVDRNRRVLGMLKGLGFTRLQVRATVAWHATVYALVALVVALPFGVLAGRWGWRLVAESLGVPVVAVIPIPQVAGVLLALVVIANLAAAFPAWRAARLSTASALRAE